MSRKYYAHSLEGRPPSEWQPLEEHLKNVADLAKHFAEDFGAGDWAYLAGLWHDIGKYSMDFQSRLHALGEVDATAETKARRVDHSTAGSQYIFKSLQIKGQKDAGKMLAYTIAGHHAGLPDGKSNEASCLTARLDKHVPDVSSCLEHTRNIPEPCKLPFHLDRERVCFQVPFFIRMIFSCLVDADFLDTERFVDEKKWALRMGYPTLKDLWGKLSDALTQLASRVPASDLNKHRGDILKRCLEAADWDPGLFSLTVPTGGGKTLSSLAFALKHALKYRMKRIIYVIPFTSIIEQNADVFRDILGEGSVLEHHSNYDPKEEDRLSRLASENWDAPIVVTTSVQFFESMFSSKPSHCRKLHNISNSVVILDEAQMLPVDLLKPSLEVLRELTSSYRTTVVLCTATQPALSKTEIFREGLERVREIVADPVKLYMALKRVSTNEMGLVSDDQLVERLKQYRQVLCIVNTRRHARVLYEGLQEKEAAYHLSGLMCPHHRTKNLNNIRQALRGGETCRVISTQLVEAGVDIDFPVVFRAAAGVDSLAQAAGRCNREGVLPDGGQVFFFTPEAGLPPGYLRQTAQTAESVMRHHEDPLSLEAVYEYFGSLYWLRGDKLDAYQILKDLLEGARHGDFPFRAVAQKYRIIKDMMEPLIIPWNDEARGIIHELNTHLSLGFLPEGPRDIPYRSRHGYSLA